MAGRKVERKKVLYIITKSNWGGAQQYVYDLATRLPQTQFEAVVVAGGNGRLFNVLRQAGIRTIAIPDLGRDIHIYNELRSLRQIFCIIKKEKPDVMHLSSSKAGALGAFAARLASMTDSHRPLVIFTAHGWGFGEDRPLLARAAIFFVSWFASLFQDKIIVLDTADFAAAEKFIPLRKLALIPNGIAGIDALSRADARAFLAEKIGRAIADDAVLIGTVAELTPNKGLAYFIEALRILNRQTATGNVQTVIIGEGEDRKKLEEQIRRNNAQDRIFLIGFIPDAARFLKAYDIFVLASLKEGLPYALMQAMAAGVNTVATRVGGIPDLITDGRDGILVPPKNAGALADAIATLAQNAERRASRDLGTRAQKTIETKFSFRAMMERTILLYAPENQ